MAVETAQQKKQLAEIAATAQLLATQEADAKATRVKLQQQMVAAKDAKVSSYKIAEAVGLSQPRVMQIIKEAEGSKATKPSPTRALRSEVAELRKELDQAHALLAQAQEVSPSE